MSIPKYSIVLPALNGAETLSVTVPEMLKIDRDDFELVISNNRSDDNTQEVLEELARHDSRLKIVVPPTRLPIGQHLEFAYQQAQGEWQGHLGDDDIIFPSRFDILDKVIDSFDVQVIRGENVRYHWPNFVEANLSNTLDGRTYSGKVSVQKGADLAVQLLNEMVIYGGGSWVVHRDVIEKVRKKCGYFSSPQHVEFFAMRAAGAVSSNVALLDLPIWVIGRHSKSAGTQGLGKKRANQTWDWSFEDPERWQFCPFQYKGYASISLDAALTVQDKFPEILGDADINWTMWLNSLHSDIMGLIHNEQLPPEAETVFAQGLNKLPSKIRFQWLLKNNNSLLTRVFLKIYNHLQARSNTHLFTSANIPSDNFGWPHYLRGEKVGINSIIDVPLWIENTFHGFFKLK